MTLQTTGPISFLNIQAEFGDVTPISLSEYYSLASGLPTSGAISLNAFYGKKFIVSEIVNSSRTWTPKANLARFIHIYVIGAGGSGGHGWPLSNGGTYGNTDGVAGGAGGGAGGVAYSVIPAASAGSTTVTIGVGGVGVRRTGEDGRVNGNAGTASTFVGSGLNMRGNGGGGGLAASASSGGGDSASAAGGAGGTATGGNTLNLTGGAGGNMSVSGDGTRRAGAGGGAPRFLSSNIGDGVDCVASNSSNSTAGAKVSSYGSYPSILNTYPVGRDQSAIVGSSVTSFDASNGTINSGGTASPVYGAGSGGSGAQSADFTGAGGDGLVVIIYEI